MTEPIKDRPLLPAGRKRKTLNLSDEQVELLARIGLSNRKIAVLAGCGDKACARHFAAVLARGRAIGDRQIAGKLYEIAMGGNVPALLLLAKNRLGYADQPEQISQGNTGMVSVVENGNSPKNPPALPGPAAV